MKTITEEKGTENRHPIREHLGLSYGRWVAVNEIVSQTAETAKNWSEVLVGLSRRDDLTGAEFVLAGAIFAEIMLKRMQNAMQLITVPEGVGVSDNHEKLLPSAHVFHYKILTFPTNQVPEMTGIPFKQLTHIKISLRSIPYDLHLAEILARAYSGLPKEDPLGLVCAGYISAAETLLHSSTTSRYTTWVGKDPEWKPLTEVS